MSKSGRGWSLALLVVAGALLVGTAASYACVPQPFITIHPLASGAAGAQVNVDGQLFSNGSRIEIRWNATDGPVLGTAQSADFSVPITIPSAPAGLYTVLAVVRNQAGVQGEVARAEFQVTGAGPAPTTAPVPVKGEPADSEGGTSFASVAAAVGLLAIGAIGGALIVGRRFKSASPVRTPTPVG